MRAVLFDLDGTLVDSAPAVFETFRWALEQHGQVARIPFDLSLIGPPLRDTLARLTGTTDRNVLDPIAATFRERYDTTGIASTPPFPGMAETLTAVHALGYELFMVTNKRIRPTRLLVDRLGVGPLFRGLFAPDAFDPPKPNKPAVVAHVLATFDVATEASAFVGDTVDDVGAAAAHGIPFVAADYGYGNLGAAAVPAAGRLAALTELPAVLRRLAG